MRRSSLISLLWLIRWWTCPRNWTRLWGVPSPLVTRHELGLKKACLLLLVWYPYLSNLLPKTSRWSLSQSSQMVSRLLHSILSFLARWTLPLLLVLLISLMIVSYLYLLLFLFFSPLWWTWESKTKNNGKLTSHPHVRVIINTSSSLSSPLCVTPWSQRPWFFQSSICLCHLCGIAIHNTRKCPRYIQSTSWSSSTLSMPLSL